MMENNAILEHHVDKSMIRREILGKCSVTSENFVNEMVSVMEVVLM